MLCASCPETPDMICELA